MIKLTKNEQIIKDYVVKGLPSKAIAQKMNIKPSTVKFHLTKIYQKHGVKSRSQLMSMNYAFEYDKAFLGRSNTKFFNVETKSIEMPIEYDMLINYNEKHDVIVLYEKKDKLLIFKSRLQVAKFLKANYNAVMRGLSVGLIKGYRVGIIKGAVR